MASLSATVKGAGGAVSFALVVGVAVAIYGASGAFGAAGRALNAVYGAEESRGFIRHKLSDIGWTVVVILLALVSLFSVFLGGGLAHDLFGRRRDGLHRRQPYPAARAERYRGDPSHGGYVPGLRSTRERTFV